MESTQQKNSFCLIIASLLLPLSLPAADTQIRLAKSESTRCSGRVEIYLNSSWGRVCDDDWSIADADVACTQLGCGLALRATQLARFGKETGEIWFIRVNCSGRENSLTECLREVETDECPHTEDAGVDCFVGLQQPSISLWSPDDGLLWGPEGAEITKRYSFVFTCSINSSYPGGHFSLISGSNIINTKPAVNHSATFNFPLAEYEHQGNYSCVYEVTLSPRKLTFNETTDTISVIVKWRLWLLISLVATGIPLFLLALLVLVVVSLVHKRRRQAKNPAVLVQTQLAVRKSAEDEEEEEEEEEGDYVNVEPVDTYQKQTKQACGDEDVDGDCSDHDYEEEDFGKIHVAPGFFVEVEDHRGEQEDEEETSDDENDYVNVTKPATELEVDIYGSDDIYQNF